MRCVYGASGASIGYDYHHDAAAHVIALEIMGDAVVDLHVMLPRGTEGRKVTCNGRTIAANAGKIRESSYVNAPCKVRGRAEVRIHYA